MAGAFLKSLVSKNILSVEKKCEGIITDEGPIGSSTEVSSDDFAQWNAHSYPVR